ncbi:MAG TPA: 4-alpha-glucanotransferase [Gammaproteobacteria bacterium]
MAERAPGGAPGSAGEEPFDRRRAGVLLHVTSLPGPSATGTLGADARRFVDWLAAGGFGVWQTLPLGPVDAYGSPYCLRSAHAGDARLIDARDLGELPELPRSVEGADVAAAPLEAYRTFAAAATAEQRRRFAAFVHRHRRWLLPYGAFCVCRQRHGEPWWHWPAPYRHRDRRALRELLRDAREALRAFLFEQYLFDLQWRALKRYANERGVLIFGDLPFYMDRDSVEVWRQPELFRLGADGEPVVVAGVPPDYFNADGQLWGNPIYDWERMRRDGFRWWVERIAGQLERFDLLRIDHFRALESYWEIPAGARTAREGRWQPGCGEELLTTLCARLGSPPLVAEDLGIITDEVRRLRDRFRLPGMVVLQFAFDGKPDNPHLPENHVVRSVAYTGTHDNDTTVGWYAKLDPHARGLVDVTLGVTAARPMPDVMIEACYASRAQLAVVPLQDLLRLGSEARMNTPGNREGNWGWRFRWEDVPPGLAAVSRDRALRSGRLP